MAKYVVLMSRRQEMSRSSFFKHYEERHASLAMALLSFAKYRRSHVADADGEPVDFDCLTEVYDAKVAATGEIAQQILEDERRFVDQSMVRTAVAEEIFLAGEAGGLDGPATRRRILLLEREGGMSDTQMVDAARTWAGQFKDDQVRRITLDLMKPQKTIHNNPVIFPGDSMLSFWPRDAVPVLPPPPAGLRLAASVMTLVYETAAA